MKHGIDDLRKDFSDETPPPPRAIMVALEAIRAVPHEITMRALRTPESDERWRRANLPRVSLLNDSWPHKVEAFRVFYERPVEPDLTALSEDELSIHHKIITEEWEEFWTAVYSGDLIQSIDGALDTIYTLLGYLVAIGLKPTQINSCFEEIHASNMTKVDEDGRPVIIGGKIQKTPQYTKPNLEAAIAAVPPFSSVPPKSE